MLPAVDATYVLARSALYPPLRLGIRWTIEGAQMIPVLGPAILASNHVSYLDPLVLAYLADRRHRRVRFLAKAELFDKPVLGADAEVRGHRSRCAGGAPTRRRRSTRPSTRSAGVSA